MGDIKIVTESFSLRVWGNFNPAILSHSFLKGIKAVADDVEVPEPIITPFASSLDYKGRGLKVIVDTDSLLVSHRADRPQVNEALGLARAYLEALGFTPTKSVSFNFCGRVEFPGEPDAASKFEARLLRDRGRVMSGLGVKRLRVAVQFTYNSGGFEVTLRLGPTTDSGLPFLLWQDKQLPDAREAALLLTEELGSARMLKACEAQLARLLKGGLGYA